MRSSDAYPIATSFKCFDLFRLEARHRNPLTAVVELTTANATPWLLEVHDPLGTM